MSGPPRRPPFRRKPLTIPQCYDALREDIEWLELSTEQPADEKLLKQLDKAITLLKSGAKILKKAIKSDKKRRTRIARLN